MSGSCWPCHDSLGFIDRIGFTVATTAQSTVHIRMQEEGKVPGLHPLVRILEMFPMMHNSVVFVSSVPGPQSVPGM